MEEQLKSHFLNMYHMALSDTQIDISELKVLYTIGEERGISKEEIDSIVLRPDLIKFSSPKDVYEKIEYLYDFARIAWADGVIDENEKRLLHTLGKKFGFEEENIFEIAEFLLEEAEKKTPKELIFKIVTENL